MPQIEIWRGPRFQILSASIVWLYVTNLQISCLKYDILLFQFVRYYHGPCHICHLLFLCLAIIYAFMTAPSGCLSFANYCPLQNLETMPAANWYLEQILSYIDLTCVSNFCITAFPYHEQAQIRWLQPSRNRQYPYGFFDPGPKTGNHYAAMARPLICSQVPLNTHHLLTVWATSVIWVLNYLIGSMQCRQILNCITCTVAPNTLPASCLPPMCSVCLLSSDTCFLAPH
jgi:hypothetical protein